MFSDAQYSLRILALFLPPVVWAQQAKLSPDQIASISQAISTEMSRSSIPGLTVAVASSAGLDWSNGYGLADLENLVPAISLTEIRLGSISKPITAVAVMQMVEQDKMQLDAPIERYVPSFPHKQWPVTIRELLGHLGGIRHYANDRELDSTRHYTDVSAPLKIFEDDPLLAEPGAKYSYSTYGFNLLGAAVESASGAKFTDYLREHVFGPAAMDHAGPDDVYAIIPHRARGYRLSAAGRLENCSLADTSNKIPGGGMISTAEDLVRFALALNAGKLVKPATRDLMFTEQQPRDGKPGHYGMGWSIAQFEGRKLVAHGGGQQGISTYLMLFPDEAVAIAVMLNREHAPAGEIARKVATAVLQR
jgi:CubicO group peptidase (beta-lactamase class C family)